MKTISDQLKHEIENCGISRYRLARETGINDAALCRFMSGERSLSLEAVQTLVDYFGYKLVKLKGK